MNGKKYWSWLNPSPERVDADRIPRTTAWRLDGARQVPHFQDLNNDHDSYLEREESDEELVVNETVEACVDSVSSQSSSDHEQSVSESDSNSSGSSWSLLDRICAAPTRSNEQLMQDAELSVSESDSNSSGSSWSLLDRICAAPTRSNEQLMQDAELDGTSASDSSGSNDPVFYHDRALVHEHDGHETAEEHQMVESSESDVSMSSLDDIISQPNLSTHQPFECVLSDANDDMHAEADEVESEQESLQDEVCGYQSDSQQSSENDVESNPEDMYPIPADCDLRQDRWMPSEENLEENITINDEGNACDVYEHEVFSVLKEKIGGPFHATVTDAPQVSRGELMLNALTFSNHFHLNFAQFEGVMKLIHSIFKKSVMPDTRFKLDVLLKSYSGMEFHFVCIKCFNYLGKLDHSVVKEIDCNICSTVNNISNLNSSLFFVMFDLPSQIEVLLSDPKISQDLKNPFDLLNNQAPHTMKDLYDGHMYQQFIASLRPENNVQNISFCFSVDGASLYSSSNCEIWPLFCCLLELPPNTRMHNLLLCGLWFGKSKPKMDIFLKPFIEKFNMFSTEGFKVKTSTQEWKIKAHLLCCCADAPARAAVQCVHQHNGSYGCNWCLHPGAGRKYKNLAHVPAERTIEELIHNGTEALNMRGFEASVNGVLGISPCLASKTFNLVSGMILEYFHFAAHGIARQLSGAWLGDDGAENIPYYFGRPSNLKAIEAFISAIRLPVEARRAVRKISEREKWKGREFENFILYFSVPIFLPILSRPFMKHWCLFVQAMHLLLQETVTERYTNTASHLLEEFVTKTEELYGLSHMTYTMHICLHLTDHVKRWGPLWSINGYCFEDGNRIVKSTIHANQGIASQVCRSLCHSKAMDILKVAFGNPSTHKFQMDIEKKFAKKCIYIGEDDRYVGNVKMFQPSEEERWKLQQIGYNNPESFGEVFKLIHKGCVYTSQNKAVCKTDNTVAYLSDSSFMIIQKIIVSEEMEVGFLIGNHIDTSVHSLPSGVDPVDAFLRTVSFIHREKLIVSPSHLKIVCARMTLPHGDFIVKVPNIFNTT